MRSSLLNNIEFVLVFTIYSFFLFGCSASVNEFNEKVVTSSNGSSIRISYLEPQDCELKGQAFFNPMFSNYFFGLFHFGPSEMESIDLSNDYFVDEATDFDANYIYRHPVKKRQMFGIYSYSVDIYSKLYLCEK